MPGPFVLFAAGPCAGGSGVNDPHHAPGREDDDDDDDDDDLDYLLDDPGVPSPSPTYMPMGVFCGQSATVMVAVVLLLRGAIVNRT